MLLMAPSSTKVRMMKLITQNFDKYEDHDVINDKPIFVVYRDYQEEAPVFYERPHRVWSIVENIVSDRNLIWPPNQNIWPIQNFSETFHICLE